MPKIKIKYTIKSNDDTKYEEVLGIKKKNNIIFKDDEYITNIQIIDDNIVIVRENEEVISTIDLNNGTNIFIKQNKSYINLKTKLIKKHIDECEIFFKYAVIYDENNSNQIECSLKYEVL